MEHPPDSRKAAPWRNPPQREVRQFRSRVETDTPVKHLPLRASHPNPVILDRAPALYDDALFEQVFVTFGMPVPGSCLKIAGQRFFSCHLQQHCPAGGEGGVKIPKNLKVLCRISEVAERAKQVQCEGKGWTNSAVSPSRLAIARAVSTYRAVRSTPVT